MSRVWISPTARAELLAIDSFISRDSPVAGAEFVERIIARCEFLGGAPRAGRALPELGRGIRVWPVGNHLIIYRIAADAVEILHVIDGRRDVRSAIQG